MLEELLEKEYTGLIRWANKNLDADHKQFAADVVNDTVIELLSSPPDLREETALTFIKEYVRNQCRDYMKVQRNRDRLEEENFEVITENLGLDEDLYPDVLDELLAEEAAEGFYERFEGLSLLLRDTLEAIEVEGKTPEEIADETGESKWAVYKRAERAKKILQGNN